MKPDIYPQGFPRVFASQDPWPWDANLRRTHDTAIARSRTVEVNVSIFPPTGLATIPRVSISNLL